MVKDFRTPLQKVDVDFSSTVFDEKASSAMHIVFDFVYDDPGFADHARPIKLEYPNQSLRIRVRSPNSIAHPGERLQISFNFHQGSVCHRYPGFLYLFTRWSGPTSAQAVITSPRLHHLVDGSALCGQAAPPLRLSAG